MFNRVLFVPTAVFLAGFLLINCVTATDEVDSADAAKPEFEPDAAIDPGKADHATAYLTRFMGDLTVGGLTSGHIGYPDYLHGYTLTLADGEQVWLDLATDASGVSAVYGPAIAVAEDGTPQFARPTDVEWVTEGQPAGFQVGGAPGTYLVVYGPTWVWDSDFTIATTCVAGCWDDEVATPAAEDLNPDVRIVEVELDARVDTVEFTPGVSSTVWTYNGLLPGPRIEANVGDTLIVHFTNWLPEETTVHWHGIELPAVMDGSHIAQLAVPANGGSFTYEFPLLRAGTYWYHPHSRGHAQVESGLQGMLIVRDPEQDTALGLPSAELNLVLDDVLLDDSGQISAEFPTDPAENAAFQVNGREGNLFLVNGVNLPTVRVRAGEPVRVRMVNTSNARFFRLAVDGHSVYQIGGDNGLDPHPTMFMPTESASGDNMDGMDDAHNMDGMDDMDDAHDMGAMDDMDDTDDAHDMDDMDDPDDSGGMGGMGGMVMDMSWKIDLDPGLMLTPGERADIVFTPAGEVGHEFFLTWNDFPRGRHMATRGDDGMIMLSHAHNDGEREAAQLVRFVVVDSDSGSAPYVPPSNLAEVEPIDITGADTLQLQFGHGMPNMMGDIEFFAQMVDGVGTPFERLRSDQALQATVGQTYVWEVVNFAMGDHNFHPHGFSFQPLEVEYVDLDNPDNNRVIPFENTFYKDTIRIPGRVGAKGRSSTIVRLAVTFSDEGREGQIEAFGKVPTADRSGGWFVHCHFLEHAARGMGTFLNLRAN